MSNKNVEVTEAYLKFFKDKMNSECAITNGFIKEGYAQKSGGYIELAAAFEFYNFLAAEDNKEFIENLTGLSLNEILHPGKEPNQKWHLMVAYLGMLYWEEKNPSFGRVTCPELWLWMLETSNLDGFDEEILKNIKSHAEHYKKREDYGGYKYSSKERNGPTREWKRFLKEYREKLEAKVIPE